MIVWSSCSVLTPITVRSNLILLKSSKCSLISMYSSIWKVYNCFFQYDLFASDYFIYRVWSFSHIPSAVFFSETSLNTFSPRLRIRALWALACTQRIFHLSVTTSNSLLLIAIEIPWCTINAFILILQSVKSFSRWSCQAWISQKLWRSTFTAPLDEILTLYKMVIKFLLWTLTRNIKDTRTL